MIINFDYRNIVAFKQIEKNFIVDEIKHNISVGIFDGINDCSAATAYSAERFIIILGGFHTRNRRKLDNLILATKAFEQDLAFFIVNIDAV